VSFKLKNFANFDSVKSLVNSLRLEIFLLSFMKSLNLANYLLFVFGCFSLNENGLQNGCSLRYRLSFNFDLLSAFDSFLSIAACFNQLIAVHSKFEYLYCNLHFALNLVRYFSFL